MQLSKKLLIVLPFVAMFTMGNEASCDGHRPSSDEIQRKQQERVLQEGTSQVGMPSIKNFREKKLLKDIFELRDQDALTTYTYLWSDMQGKRIFLCDSIGYGIPYATQFTNPQKVVGGFDAPSTGNVTIAQADPNGLFSPASANGTWVMCKDPNGKQVRPVFIEPNVIVSPFKLDAEAK